MGKQEITVQKENILNAYKQASKEQKTLLENMFGKDIFKPKDITEHIKTFEDACETLGSEHPLVIEYKTISGAFDITDDLFAYLELRIICAALNEGWEPTFDKDECRYYLWFYIYSKEEYKELDEDKKKECRVISSSSLNSNANAGLVYVNTNIVSSGSYSNLGSRLAFKTKELAEYCGKQFKDIWADFLFPRN